MFLTEANVLYYLLEKRFASPDEAVRGTFLVRALRRRNLNLRVTCGEREYLVKQVRKWDSEGQASLEREAALYWRAKTDPCFGPLAEITPQCYAWDPANAVLILEYLPEHTELYDLADRFAPDLARLAGRAMGAFHRDMQAGEHASSFPVEIPWCLSLHEANQEELAEPNEGRRELLRVVTKHSGFGRALDRLREEWREEAVIHGDWKLDNCLIPPGRDRLRVVDWEFAGWSDPLWDVATMLQSYWNFWVRWPSRSPIEEIRPALRAFLQAYAQARGCETKDVAARAIRFGGARMLQTAYEALDKAERMTAEGAQLAQVSLNILERPEWAGEQLLGMASTCSAS